MATDAEPDLSAFPPSLRSKRILLCTESFGPVNGVSRTTLMLVNHLRSHGAHVAVVAPLNHTKHNTFTPSSTPAPSSPRVAGADDGTGGDAEPLSLSPESQIEVRVHGYPLPFNPELSIVYPVRNSTLYARTFGAETAPDLIYLASPASLGFQVMLQVRQQPRERQVPVLCNFQTDLAGYCKILFPFPLSRFADMAFAGVQSYLFRHPSVKTIFYPSRFVRRYLDRQGVQPGKMELLTRGVNTEQFNPEKRSEELRREIAPNGEIILATVSRIAGEKGFDFLAKAAFELESRGLDFKLYIVGGNRNKDVESEVQELFEPLRSQGRVIFAGFKHGEELATAYASADLFVYPSITETFGLVVLESMASGVPVVARDEGGPSDIVEHGETGFLIPPDDVDDFVSKTLLLARDAGLRKRMSARARSAACEATWEKINNKVAWRMADTIAAREKEQAERKQVRDLETARGRRVVSAWQGAAAQGGGSAAAVGAAVPVYGWLMLNEAVRETVMARVVDARLVSGMAVIMGFWFFTGLYMVFTETALWSKARVKGWWDRSRRGSVSSSAATSRSGSPARG